MTTSILYCSKRLLTVCLPNLNLLHTTLCYLSVNTIGFYNSLLQIFLTHTKVMNQTTGFSVKLYLLFKVSNRHLVKARDLVEGSIEAIADSVSQQVEVCGARCWSLEVLTKLYELDSNVVPNTRWFCCCCYFFTCKLSMFCI